MLVCSRDWLAIFLLFFLSPTMVGGLATSRICSGCNKCTARVCRRRLGLLEYLQHAQHAISAPDMYEREQESDSRALQTVSPALNIPCLIANQYCPAPYSNYCCTQQLNGQLSCGLGTLWGTCSPDGGKTTSKSRCDLVFSCPTNECCGIGSDEYTPGWCATSCKDLLVACNVLGPIDSANTKTVVDPTSGTTKVQDNSKWCGLDGNQIGNRGNGRCKSPSNCCSIDGACNPSSEYCKTDSDSWVWLGGGNGVPSEWVQETYTDTSTYCGFGVIGNGACQEATVEGSVTFGTVCCSVNGYCGTSGTDVHGQQYCGGDTYDCLNCKNGVMSIGSSPDCETCYSCDEGFGFSTTGNCIAGTVFSCPENEYINEVNVRWFFYVNAITSIECSGGTVIEVNVGIQSGTNVETGGGITDSTSSAVGYCGKSSGLSNGYVTKLHLQKCGTNDRYGYFGFLGGDSTDSSCPDGQRAVGIQIALGAATSSVYYLTYFDFICAPVPAPTSLNTTSPTILTSPPSTLVPTIMPTILTPAPTPSTPAPAQTTPSPTGLTFSPVGVPTPSPALDTPSPTLRTPFPTSMPTTPAAYITSAPTVECSTRYEQCGGQAYVAEGKPTTCCSDTDVCVPQADNIWYSQCLPIADIPPTPAPHSSGTTLSPASTECSRLWEQCGGTVCTPQTNNPWYSQCLPEPPTPATMDTTPSPTTTNTPVGCSARWEQCGGTAWVAEGKPTTCCSAADICVPQAHNIWYSQCLPIQDIPPTPAPQCSRLWEQCGGINWVAEGKPQCCVIGTVCVPQTNNPWYSQCLPHPSAQPTTSPYAAPTSSDSPTGYPTLIPTQVEFMHSPSEYPTPPDTQSVEPTLVPSIESTSSLTKVPSSAPTSSQAQVPTSVAPSEDPSTPPLTEYPTESPTSEPTEYRTDKPIASPTTHPTNSPTEETTPSPTEYPTSVPTHDLTPSPTEAAMDYKCSTGSVIDSIKLRYGTGLNAISSYKCMDAAGNYETKTVDVGDGSAGTSVDVKGSFIGVSSGFAVSPDPADAASGMSFIKFDGSTVPSTSLSSYGTMYTGVTTQHCAYGEVLCGFTLASDSSGTMVRGDMKALCAGALTESPTPSPAEAPTNAPQTEDSTAAPSI